jgi:hypothetical protein
MAYFAELDETNKVIRVLVVSDTEASDGENFLANVCGLGGRWIETFQDGSQRGVYAGEDFIYDEEEDIFITPQPYLSWSRTGCFWNAPTPMPTNGIYTWNEEDQAWVEFVPLTE